MNKTLQKIQEENRKFIIMANNPTAKTYDEALEMELGFGCQVIDLKHQFFGKVIPEKMTLVYDCFENDGGYAYFLHYRGNPAVRFERKDILDKKKCKIIGKPLTLNRVLNSISRIYPSSTIYQVLDSWHLKKETLEEQSEETQREFNKLLKL